jgi:hypothetical protein
LEQRGGWFYLVVGSGARRCEFADRSAVFFEGTRRRQVAYSTLDDAARGMRAYLEGSRGLDDRSVQ